MDAATFGADVVAAVRSFLEQEVDPLLAQIESMRKEIDALKGAPAPKEIDPDWLVGRALRDVTPELIKLRDEMNLLNPKVEHIGAMIGDEIAKYVAKTVPADIAAAIEAAKPEPVDFKAMIDEAVAALPPAERGKDADPVEVAAQIAVEVERAVAALPAAKDGQSITIDDVRPLIEEAVTKAVTLIPVPKDGIDGNDGRNGLDAVKFFCDAHGHLVVVKSDGSTDDLGEYVGKDGAPGARGNDGADGVGFDDMEFHYDGERTATFRFTKGDRVREEKINLPVMLYRGIFREGESYKQGDVCTWGGHVWHCDTDTNDKPDGNERCWTMAMRKARDGKDGIVKPVAKSGPVKVG